MPSNYLIFCHLFLFCIQSFPASGSFSVNGFFSSGRQSIGASAPVSVPPMNIQGWFALRLTGLIPLQSKGFSRVFSSTIIRHQFFRTHPSLSSVTFHVPISYLHFLFGKKSIQFYPFFKLGCFIKYLRRRQWHPTPVLLPGKSHGWRSLVCCSPWGR